MAFEGSPSPHRDIRTPWICKNSQLCLERNEARVSEEIAMVMAQNALDPAGWEVDLERPLEIRTIERCPILCLSRFREGATHDRQVVVLSYQQPDHSSSEL